MRLGCAVGAWHTAFLDAGWGFVGEPADAAADMWWILEGQDYPRLC
ncbi:MAG TPA: hypothetical protein PKZ07_01735 [Sedimentisphaerales bacterium]|nr:hypothetical protein [Sedimentisphaerales bacterium]